MEFIVEYFFPNSFCKKKIDVPLQMFTAYCIKWHLLKNKSLLDQVPRYKFW